MDPWIGDLFGDGRVRKISEHYKIGSLIGEGG